MKPNRREQRSNRIDRRKLLSTLGGAGVIGLAGCLGSDDDTLSEDGDDGGSRDGDDSSDATDDASDDTADDGTVETDGDSDEDGDDAGDGDGTDDTAEITVLGETHTSSGLRVQCYDEGTTLASTFQTEFHVGADLWVVFGDDPVEVRSTIYTESLTADDYDGQEDKEMYRTEVDRDELDFDIDEGGDSNYASGTVHLEPDNDPAEDANPDGIEVEFEIRCHPGDPNGDETGEESADAPDDVDDEAETDDETVADEDEAVHPADLDIGPEDGWGEPHDGVEVPDESGRAVLVIDGERFELEGNCEGGEVHAEDEDEEREMRAEHGHFTFRSAFHAEGEGHLAAMVSRIVGIGQLSGTNRSQPVEELDQFELGGEDSAAIYQFLRYADGETESVEEDGVTEADEPFVRIDPSGVMTARGVLERAVSRIDPETEEFPLGEFEFGARCQSDWDEGWGEF